MYVIRRKNLVCIIRDDQGRGMKGIEHLDDGRCIHCKIVREARNKIDEARTEDFLFIYFRFLVRRPRPMPPVTSAGIERLRLLG